MKHKILVVDDSSSDVELLLVVLRSLCSLLDVYVARDGQEALDFLLPVEEQAASPPPDLSLILLDIKMPKVDGLEVLTALKADPRTKTTPVVMFTSSNEERDVEMSYQTGANGYVVKPVDFQEYQDLLGHIVGYWLDANRLPGDEGRHRSSGNGRTNEGVKIYECRTLSKRSVESK